MTEVKGKGGRPAKDDISRVDHAIIVAGTALFLKYGYGDVSIERIAKTAGVSKRTIYHRYSDKSELFAAAIHSLILKISPPKTDELFIGGDLKQILNRLAEVILKAALSAEALALHRLLISEAKRFPVLAKIMVGEGRRGEAIDRISALLKIAVDNGEIKIKETEFAAEQFLQMILSTPQNRALGLGEPMTEAEIKDWGSKTVEFFLKACNS